jgi:hypothetical protein
LPNPRDLFRRRAESPGVNVRCLPIHTVEIDYRGRHRFVPFTAVNEVRDDAVILTVDREAVDTLGWDVAPTTAS